MADAQFSEDEAQTMTLAVEWGGREFSPAPDTVSRPPRDRIRKLHARREETQLPGLLHDAIFSRLTWNTIPSDHTDRQPLVETYIASLKQLDGFRQDVQTMVRCACLANLEFRQGRGKTHVGARDAVLAKKLDEMFSRAAAHWLPMKNVLDAKVVAQPVSVLRDQLRTALSEAAADFAKQFFELLARLVDRQLFGLVEWLPNHCCNYHFFKQVVIQENEGASQRVAGMRIDDFNPRDPEAAGRIIGRRTIHDIRGEGKHYHRFARHEHSVMNAGCTTIRISRVVVPPQVVPLLERIPEWLYPLVQMIDGDIIRERIIEQDTRVENWADVQVRDEPIFGWEPAVIIGPYVLTGWGPREVGQEQARRKTVEKTATAQTARRRAPWLVVASVAMTLVALLLLIEWLRGAGGGVFVVLATAAAIGAVWQAAFDFATARHSPTAALAAHFLAATFAFQLLLGYWLIARWFQPMSWVTPVVLVVSAVLAHAVGRRFQ